MLRLVVKGGGESSAPKAWLASELKLFQNHTELLSGSRYLIQSDVGIEVLDFFMQHRESDSSKRETVAGTLR